MSPTSQVISNLDQSMRCLGCAKFIAESEAGGSYREGNYLPLEGEVCILMSLFLKPEKKEM